MYRLTRHSIGSIYNAAFGVTQQEAVEEWCRAAYPKIWQAVLERGRDEDDLGMQRVKGVDRTLEV